MFKNKKVLITGGAGMIGLELLLLMEEAGAIVSVADKRTNVDLTQKNLCTLACQNKDYVFHLAGIKGSPKRTAERPTDFMIPMLQFDSNMIEAAQLAGVKKFLYTSSIAVLNPETDRFPAWAKMTAETTIDAMRIQYPNGTQFSIVRPANVYGRFDNFDNEYAMVITSLIKKALEHNTYEIWGTGSEERDFINARDVARAMKLTMEQMPVKPINIGSGESYKIRNIEEIISKETGSKPYYNLNPQGGKRRVMDITDLTNMGFKKEVEIGDGIREAIGYAIRRKTSSYNHTHER